jgi:hypothetical protein
MTISADMTRTSLLCFLIAVGCGSGAAKTNDGGADAGLTAQQACGDLAQAECTERTSCSGGANITRVFGNLNECIIRETLTCLDGLAAPQTGNSPALVEQCVIAFGTYSCADYFNNNPPAVCAAIGPRSTGAVCAVNGQCASGYCAGTKNTLCGTCAEPPAAGASCASSSCGHDQMCVDATMLCEGYGTTGAACDADTPCGNGLDCVGDVASTSEPGTCQAAAAGAATPCGGTMPGCDGTQGWFCGGPAGAKTCMAVTFVGDTMPCGSLSATSFAGCTAGSCYTSTGVAGAGQTGTCKTDVLEGAGCDTVLGPACLLPARCVTSGDASAGTCTLPSGATCG